MKTEYARKKTAIVAKVRNLLDRGTARMFRYSHVAISAKTPVISKKIQAGAFITISSTSGMSTAAVSTRFIANLPYPA
jgi:hypothetical protein